MVAGGPYGLEELVAKTRVKELDLLRPFRMLGPRPYATRSPGLPSWRVPQCRRRRLFGLSAARRVGCPWPSHLCLDGSALACVSRSVSGRVVLLNFSREPAITFLRPAIRYSAHMDLFALTHKLINIESI